MTPPHPYLLCPRWHVDAEYSVLDAIQRDNVTLVTDGIRRVTETGIETVDGEHARGRRDRLRDRLPRDGVPLPDDDHRT